MLLFILIHYAQSYALLSPVLCLQEMLGLPESKASPIAHNVEISDDRFRLFGTIMLQLINQKPCRGPCEPVHHIPATFPAFIAKHT